MSIGRLSALKGHRVLTATAWSGVAQVLPQLVGLATIPFIMATLGASAYGVWALVNVLIMVLTTLDGGISASAQRFFALYSVSDEHRLAGRLALTLALLIVGLGTVLVAIGPWLAALVLRLSSVPPSLAGSAAHLFGRLGILVTLLLLANLFMGYLRAHEHFGRVAVAMTLSQTALVAGLVFVGQSLTLESMFYVAVAQLAVLAGCMALLSPRLLGQMRFAFAGREQLREFWAYSNRSLVMNVSTLAILQAGPIFVAANAPIEQVGYLTVAGMLASAVRSFPLFAIVPALTSLTRAFGKGGVAGAAPLASRLNDGWVPATVGLTCVAMGSTWFVVRGWAGDVPIIGGAAILLTLANGFNLTSALSSASCRAFGRPGLEARYGVALTVGVLGVSWIAARVGGALAVAGAVAIVQGVALVYFNRLMRVNLPTVGRGWKRPMWLVSALVAGALAALLASASLAFAPHSIRALAVALGGAALAGAAFLGLNRAQWRRAFGGQDRALALPQRAEGAG